MIVLSRLQLNTLLERAQPQPSSAALAATTVTLVLPPWRLRSLLKTGLRCSSACVHLVARYLSNSSLLCSPHPTHRAVQADCCGAAYTNRRHCVRDTRRVCHAPRLPRSCKTNTTLSCTPHNTHRRPVAWYTTTPVTSSSDAHEPKYALVSAPMLRLQPDAITAKFGALHSHDDEANAIAVARAGHRVWTAAHAELSVRATHYLSCNVLEWHELTVCVSLVFHARLCCTVAVVEHPFVYSLCCHALWMHATWFWHSKRQC